MSVEWHLVVDGLPESSGWTKFWLSDGEKVWTDNRHPKRWGEKHYKGKTFDGITEYWSGDLAPYGPTHWMPYPVEPKPPAKEEKECLTTSETIQP